MHVSRVSIAAFFLSVTSAFAGENWKADPIWHDGLVEKATYTATRLVYGKPRQYEAIFFTNKEQHDTKTWTKASRSSDTVEVFKHNEIEVIPTPNYDYKYTTTAHLTVGDLELTRLDMSSQEFCGTTFKQYLIKSGPRGQTSYDYFAFSYMPEAGRESLRVERPEKSVPLVAFNSLPVWLRDYDFSAKANVRFDMLPDQKSNRATPAEPVAAEVRYGEVDGDSAILELHVFQTTKLPAARFAGDATLVARFWFANDRQHVMTQYEAADGGQTYRLKSQKRVNYWTIRSD